MERVPSLIQTVRFWMRVSFDSMAFHQTFVLEAKL